MFAPYEVPPHIPENCRFRWQTKQFRVIIHSKIVFTPCPKVFQLLPLHLTPATSPFRQVDSLTPNHPTLMLQIPKPSWSAMPHCLSHTLKTHKTEQILFYYSSMTLQSSHHHLLQRLQTLQIFSLHHICIILIASLQDSL